MAVMPINPLGVSSLYSVVPVRKVARVTRRADSRKTSLSGGLRDAEKQTIMPAASAEDTTSDDTLYGLFSLQKGG